MTNIDPLDIGPRGPYCDIDALLRERFAARDWKLFSRRPARSVQSGNIRTRFRGRGVDFEEVRVYQPGDDIRSIDWRVTARTQVPHTKLYSEERERPVYLLCDRRAPMFFGSVNTYKSVLACHACAALGWAALAGGDRVGALVFGNDDFRDVRPKRNKHAVLSLIHHLSDYNHALKAPLASHVHQSLAQMLKDTRRIAKPGSALFIASDLHDLDDEAEKQLFHLGRHLDITLLHLWDPLEREIAGRGALTVTDGEQRQTLPAGDRHFQRQYREQAEARRAQLVERANRLGIELLSLSTAERHIDTLRARYGRRHNRTRRQT